VAIDIKNDELISFAVAAKTLPGKSVDPRTIWRWAKHGVRGVRLESYKVGRHRYTTEDAVIEFLRLANRKRAN